MAETTEAKGPRHVAVIMDGNGRWAQKRGRPRLFGHHAGARRVREIVGEVGQCLLRHPERHR